MARVLRSPALAVALLATVLALSFLGQRGIWDPDEGRYANVAVNMLESGDWLNPRRTGDVGHWTKPPLTYWAIAASVGTFGLQSWAARLPMALSYLLSAWLAWRIARRLAPGTEAAAATAYATMLFPFGAAQLVTTDYLLAACETLAVWAFVEARFVAGRLAGAPLAQGRASPHRPAAWIALMWAAFALAFLTKGPPGLLPLLVLLVFDQLMPGGRSHRVLQWSGIALFTLLALPWYVAVIHDNPGLFEYFVGDEVVNRVTTNEFGRHGEWYGWLVIYVPTLLLGTLPWTASLVRWVRELPAAARRWRHANGRDNEAAPLLLALWVLLPLLVFCLSRSRMPLYILPLFVPLALLVAIQRQREGRSLPRWPWLVAWALALLALKFAAGFWPTHKNAEEWAGAIRARMPQPVHEVVFVEDMARYGLRLHLDVEVEKVSLASIAPGSQPRFNPPVDEDLATELAESEQEPGAVWICKQALWPEVQARIAALGFRAVALGTPHRDRVIFRVEPAPAR